MFPPVELGLSSSISRTGPGLFCVSWHALWPVSVETCLVLFTVLGLSPDMVFVSFLTTRLLCSQSSVMLMLRGWTKVDGMLGNLFAAKPSIKKSTKWLSHWVTFSSVLFWSVSALQIHLLCSCQTRPKVAEWAHISGFPAISCFLPACYQSTLDLCSVREAANSRGDRMEPGEWRYGDREWREGRKAVLWWVS